MRNEAVVTEILKQALEAAADAPDRGTPGHAEAAERLGDEFYRLCVEFGLSFNEFKADVLEEVLDRSRSRRGGSAGDPRRSCLDHFEMRLPLVVFALELMREDEAW